jgi:FkbH-like protein
MTSRTHHGVIVSDFNASNFAGCLKNNEEAPNVEAVVSPFGQVMPVLIQDDLDCWRGDPDFAVVWTQPQGVIKSFGPVLRYETAPSERLLEEVDEYAAALAGLSKRVKSVFVPTWAVPSYYRDFGLLDLKAGTGISHWLMRMNLRLAENFEKSVNVHILNSQKWIETAGKRAFSPRLWYMGKIVFGNEVFIEAARDVKAALRGLGGQSKKLVLVDLDDTLWGGIVGDLGWENVALGGHHAVGEAFSDFQRALKALTHRGILLGIVSKNDETVALEAIRCHPDMVLRLEDFVGWRINWRDKAENIVELVRSLNLGLQSVVFIDDSPAERARVREALPEVLVPEWPEDKLLYESTLRGLLCFNSPAVTREDVDRTRMYAAEAQREDSKRTMASVEEWLGSLGVTAKVEPLNEVNLQRAAQLLNKTNQMNLTTRRMTEAELLDWARKPNHRLWTVRVADRFGDSGLTGIVSLKVQGETGTIVDFVLSCRVMGRKVEEAMLHIAGEYARSQKVRTLKARYLATEKNRPCLDFWQRSAFAPDGTGTVFAWNLDAPYPRPESVTIEGNDA